MIYFAQADGTDLVKIGCTAGDPTKRLRELQTGCPQPLKLIAAVDGGEADEARWHRDFAADRVNGEWFRLTIPLLLAILAAVPRQPSGERAKQPKPRRPPRSTRSALTMTTGFSGPVRSSAKPDRRSGWSCSTRWGSFPAN